MIRRIFNPDTSSLPPISVKELNSFSEDKISATAFAQRFYGRSIIGAVIVFGGFATAVFLGWKLQPLDKSDAFMCFALAFVSFVGGFVILLRTAGIIFSATLISQKSGKPMSVYKISDPAAGVILEMAYIDHPTKTYFRRVSSYTSTLT